MFRTILQALMPGKRGQARLARLEGGLVGTEIALLEEMTGKHVDDLESYLQRRAQQLHRTSLREVDQFLAGGLETLDDLHYTPLEEDP